jgi:phenylalanyl-tRNA synthetase beta chain
MVDRLARCGQRSVTALVDISNYVMFEYGRPSHIFDLDKIHDKLVVRWGRKGETLKLLNGNTIEVDEQVGVIADAQAVESLAGIMGGDATAVSDDTRNVYVEAAFWWPEAVAGRSRRFNFSTDAGHRFERGVDPALTVEHIERITQLIHRHLRRRGRPDGRPGAGLPPATPVTLRVARAAKVIGMPVTQAQCADVFRAWACLHRRRRHADRHAAELALRPEDRGRPDRGGDARHRLRQAAATPPLAPVTARCAAKRGAAPRAAPCAGRRWTTRRPSTSASSRRAGSTSWPATPTPIRC